MAPNMLPWIKASARHAPESSRHTPGGMIMFKPAADIFSYTENVTPLIHHLVHSRATNRMQPQQGDGFNGKPDVTLNIKISLYDSMLVRIAPVPFRNSHDQKGVPGIYFAPSSRHHLVHFSRSGRCRTRDFRNSIYRLPRGYCAINTNGSFLQRNHAL